MSYKTVQELEHKLRSDLTFTDRLSKIFSIRELYRNAIRKKNFKPTSELIGAIELTTPGSQLMKRAIQLFGCSEPSAKFCIFLLLFHHDLFVDINATKISKLLECLDADIIQGKLHFPWIFDHFLYDRAFELFTRKTSDLSIEETETLLAETPQGVFQAGNFLVGPFGVLQSEQSRCFLPTRKVPLYHCSDPTCGQLHMADLYQPDIDISNMSTNLRRVLTQEISPMSEWWRAIIDTLVPDDHWYDDFALTNLVWLLGDGFSHSEFQIIADRIISEGKKDIRDKFPSRYSAVLSKGSTEIARNLTKPQLLQVILLRSDNVVAATIDYLIDHRHIKIPPTEIRRIISGRPLNSWAGAIPQCSDLGIRVIGHGNISTSMAKLKRLILDVHKSDESKEQLIWSLRHIPGATIGQQIEMLTFKESPATLLRNTIINNFSTLKAALAFMKASHLSLPRNDVEEYRFVEKLLWRLGFDKRDFESPSRSFWNLLAEFRRVVSLHKHLDTTSITSIRSVGVNLFVGLEKLLNSTLLFICWVFLNDPFRARHTFSAKEGMRLLNEHLNGVVETSRGKVVFDIDGKNTMFPLIMGFKAFAEKCHEILSSSDQQLKSSDVLAHFHGKSSLQLFPYRHHMYICDISPSDAEALIDLCGRTATKLQQSKVFEIRNKLEHNTEELPDDKEMIRCCELLTESISELEECGLVPTIYATKEIQADSFDRVWVVSQNGDGKEIMWQPSPALHAIKSLPKMNAPQFIVNGIKVAETNEPLRFRPEEDSEYKKMWRDYPKHGTRLNPIPVPQDQIDANNLIVQE